MRHLFLVVILLTLLPTSALAHPGRTDSSGGHTCRTNCEDWGLDYGEYHYHNGGYTTPYSTPYNTPYTTPVMPSPKLSPKPTSSPSPTPIPSPSPSPTPEVKGETTETSPSPETTAIGGKEETSSGNALMGFGIMAAIIVGGFWLVRKSLRKFKGQPPSQNE